MPTLQHQDDKLTYLLEYLRLEIELHSIEGLQVWAEHFISLREAGLYDLCERLLNIVKTFQLGQLARRGRAE